MLWLYFYHHIRDSAHLAQSVFLVWPSHNMQERDVDPNGNLTVFVF